MSPSRFRVLLVEDNVGDTRLLEESLRENESFVIAANARRLSDAIELLREGDFDLILLDMSLPDSSGFDTFLQLNKLVPHVPIIVLSGLDDEELALRTVHAGAQDYLAKGRFDGQLLLRAMRYAIERNRAEHALAHERDLLQSLLDHIPDRIYFKDRDSRFLRVNPAMLRLFNKDKYEDVIGKSDADFIDPAQAQRFFEDELQVIHTGEPLVAQIEKEVRADGRTRWVLTTKLPLRDRQGRVIGTTGISRDVTEFKRMEEQLAAERNLLRGVIDNLPDPIYVKNVEGRYLLDNIAHARFLGVKEGSEIIGKTVFDFFPQEVAEHFKASDDIITRSGEPLLNHEEIATSSAGERRWLLTTKVPLRNESGKITGLVCIGRDITEQKLADDRVRAANVELSAALADLKKAHEELRGIQLQLIEAEKMKSIGRLAAGVAHEVKNPLAIITMGIDYLRQQDFADDSNVPHILKDLTDAVQRADNVIRGLLDFSAPRKLEVSEQNLNEIIERSLRLVRGEMRGSGFHIVKQLQPDLPRVKLDAMKVGQVFINLFTNAAHAIEKSGTLTVRTFAQQLTGVGANIGGNRSESFRVGDTVIIVEVDDTGPGISEDKLTKVFDPFYTTKPTGQGTGLGLSVTRSIMDLHGGIIEIRNRPEGGARVTLMFKG